MAALVGVLSLSLLAACGGAPDSVANEDVGTTISALDCGQQCQISCISGCNAGYHYSWQQARCVADSDGCDDGYACDFGPCGGANERVCNTAGTGCGSCNGGTHFDAATGRCQLPVPSGTCDDGFYYSIGPCGGAGQRECSLASGCSACNSGLFFDGAGPCQNGLCVEVTDRCQPLPPPAPNVPPHSDLTFFVANDIHINRGYGDGYQINVWVMNNVNTAYPAGWPVGALSPGPIARPAGVLIAGDITTCSDCAAVTYSQNEILPFRDLYDQGRTPYSIDYPVYLGRGNHDYSSSSGNSKNDLMSAYQQSRMKGQMGVTNYDDNSQSYSWDWGNVHFIQANLFPGASDGGLNWLVQDLASHVGTSGRPVVVLQHYGWDNFSKEMTDNAGDSPSYNHLTAPNYNCVTDAAGEIMSCKNAKGVDLSWQWWSYADRDSEDKALAPYNVVAIFTGHLHNQPAYLHVPSRWSGPGYDVYRGSSGGDSNAGGFLVVHMNDTGLDVMHLGYSYGATNAWNAPAPPPGVPSEHALVNTSSLDDKGNPFTDFWTKRYPSPTKRHPSPAVYADSNYSGISQTLAAGRYDMGQLTVGNDVISSLRVPPGWKVTLYADAGFSGNTKVVTSDTAALPDFNDATSSMVVEGPPYPAVYADNGYSGISQTLTAGRYDMGQLTVGNDVISSLRVPPGWKVTLYADAGFSGNTKVVTSDTSALPDFNDVTSSMVVECPPDQVSAIAGVDASSTH